MKLNVYAIYDSKVNAYLNPFYMRSDGEAVRAVTEAAKDRNSNFCKYPADFTLFRVAEYDDQSGRFYALDAHVNLGNLLSLVNVERANDGENNG